jgi:hypothetical protein
LKRSASHGSGLSRPPDSFVYLTFHPSITNLIH